MKTVPRTLLVLLAASLGLKLAVWWSVTASDPSLFFQRDSHSYHDSARALVEHGVFAVSPDRPDVPQTTRTPGYPLLLAAVYAVFGQRPAAAVAVQILLSLATIVLVHRLGAESRGSRTGMLAALLMTLDLASFCSSQLLLTETLFTLLICGVLLCAARFDAAASRARWALLLGLSLALATLVRPISYYLVPLLGAWVALAARRRLGTWKRVAASVALFAAPCVLLLGGWQLRNQQQTGAADFSSIAGRNLLLYRAAAVVALRDGVGIQEARQQLLELHPETRDESDAQRGARWRRQGMEVVLRHPWLTARVTARGLASILLASGEHTLMRLLGIPVPPTGPLGDLRRLSPRSYLQRWLVDRPLEWAAWALACGFLAVLYLGAGAWMVDRLRSGRIGLRDLCFWGIFFYLLLLSAGPEAYHRFRVPLTPILCLYAAAGWSTWRPWLPRRPKGRGDLDPTNTEVASGVSSTTAGVVRRDRAGPTSDNPEPAGDPP